MLLGLANEAKLVLRSLKPKNVAQFDSEQLNKSIAALMLREISGRNRAMQEQS